MTSPDYSVRGVAVVVAGKSFGFALSKDRECDLCLKRTSIKVLYVDSTGEWHEGIFPIELVQPYVVHP